MKSLRLFVVVVGSRVPLASAWSSHHRTLSYGNRRQSHTLIYRSLLSSGQPVTLRRSKRMLLEMTTSMSEIEQLTKDIEKHNQLYYNQQPILSDEEYDALVARKNYLLEKQQQQVGQETSTTASSPENQESSHPELPVGAPPEDERPKQRHLQPMLSLDNVNNQDQLLAWIQRLQKLLASRETQENNDNETIVTTILSEPKLDGLSLSLRYQRETQDINDNHGWKLQWAATRGDGREGTDVTYAVQGLLPAQLMRPLQPRIQQSILEVRGEIVMPRSVFRQPHIRQQFSNARNAASGILLRKTSSTNTTNDATTRSLQNLLQFYAYDIVIPAQGQEEYPQEAGLDYLEIRRQLEDWGFATAHPMAITQVEFGNDRAPFMLSEVQPMLDYFQAFLQHRRTLQSNEAPTNGKQQSTLSWGDYDMDGCVHKVCEVDVRKILGESTRAPRWAIAHKPPSQAMVTKLLGIKVEVGRTGALTPVAILEPVNIDGVQVQRATLHNFIHMRDLLGGGSSIVKGSSIIIRRAGEVIPQVMQLVGDAHSASDGEEAISLEPPKVCPCCGSPAIFDISEQRKSPNATSAGQVLRCSGPGLGCKPRAVASIAHAFSRDALYIPGLSEARIHQLMDHGFVGTPADLFSLVQDENKLEELAKLGGWGKKSVANLSSTTKAIAKKEVGLARVIYSLNIRHVGVNTAELIARIYTRMDDFLEDLCSVDQDASKEGSFLRLLADDESTKGIGPVVISALRNFALDPKNIAAVKSLVGHLNIREGNETVNTLPAIETSAGRPFQDLSVVFTGTLLSMSRSEAQNLAKRLGARATPSSISKSTGLVVAGLKSGKKQRDAEELGVRVVSEDEFLRMAGAVSV